MGPLDGIISLPSQAPDLGGLLGHRVAIGAGFEVHILISGLVSGFTMLGPIAEWLGYVRRRPNYDRLAHGLGRFLVLYFGFGAATAIVLISILLVALWGQFWTILNRVLFWPFYVEAWTFFLMVIGVYLWYYTWDVLGGPFKWLHMALGGILAIASALQVAMIDIVASYMLTPVPPGNPVSVFLNPTSYPLEIHRTIANLAYAGYAIGGFAAFRYLRTRDRERRAFWDWAGSFGVIWGIAMTLLQPVVGYDYAKEIQLHAYGAWYRMMQGDLSPAFLAQIFLLGLLLLFPTWYFWRRLRSGGGRGAALMLGLTWLLGLTTLFAALPYHLALTYDQVQAAHLNRPFWQGGLIDPFAAMIPYKILALIAYTVLAMAAVFLYLRGMASVPWGGAGRVEQRLLILTAVFTMAMIVLMGFIREDGRYPDLIGGQIQQPGQLNVNQAAASSAGVSVPGAAATVRLVDSPETVGAFDPPTIRVRPGQTVAWVNQSGDYHTVTFTATDVSSSQGFAPGQAFEVRFPRPGTYRYVCQYHPGMAGVVVVA